MISLSFPLFLPSLLLSLALLAFLFRRFGPVVPGVAGGAITLLGVWLAGEVPANGLKPFIDGLVVVDWQAEVMRHGLSLQLLPHSRPILTLILLLTGAALLLAASVNQGREFPALALLLAAGYSLLLLLTDAPVNPLLIVPAFLALLSALGVFVLQGNRLGDTLGALRSLLPPMVAFPLFILASWHIDSLAINPQDSLAGAEAARLLALGLLLLLAPAPFHSAGPATAESAPPLATALLLLLYQAITLMLVFRSTLLFPVVVASSPLSLWLSVAGLVTAIWGGVAAAGTSHPGRLWGYALLHDWGLILLMLAAPDESKWSLILFLFALRAIGALAGATGLAYIHSATGSLKPAHLRGVGRALPWSTSAYILASLGMAGFPLSAGFAGHWAALQTVALNDWRVAAAVLLASAGVVVGYVRLIRIFYNPDPWGFLPAERLHRTLIAVAAIVAVSGVALAPQLLSGPVDWMLTAFRG